MKTTPFVAVLALVMASAAPTTANAPATFTVAEGETQILAGTITADAITVHGTILAMADLTLVADTITITDTAQVIGAPGASATADSATATAGGDGASLTFTAGVLVIEDGAHVQSGSGGAGGSIFLNSQDARIDAILLAGADGNGGVYLNGQLLLQSPNLWGSAAALPKTIFNLPCDAGQGCIPELNFACLSLDPSCIPCPEQAVECEDDACPKDCLPPPPPVLEAVRALLEDPCASFSEWDMCGDVLNCEQGEDCLREHLPDCEADCTSTIEQIQRLLDDGLPQECPYEPGQCEDVVGDLLPPLPDAGQEGGAVMACLAPGFINCSLAMATAVGICKDYKYIKEVCIGAGFGAVGGLSSVAITGGGARGTVNSIPAFCDWQGGSGGCTEPKFALEFECLTIAASGNGYLSFLGSSTVGAVFSLPGPTVVAVASPDCDTSASASVQHRLTPQEVEDDLKGALLEQLEQRPPIQYEGVISENIRVQAEEMQNQFYSAIAAQVNSIVVTDDYKVMVEDAPA